MPRKCDRIHVTSYEMNVINNAKGWFRATKRECVGRSDLKSHERRLYDAVSALFESEKREKARASR